MATKAERCSIHFPQGTFANLRARLLADLSRESFAVLLGKREQVGGLSILKVLEARFPRAADYAGRGVAHLRLRREYIYDLLCEVGERADSRFLQDTFDGLHYASIVLSRSDYSARLWTLRGSGPQAEPARGVQEAQF